MNHQCDCGEIAETTGEGLLIATCKYCGSYYIYAHEIREPKAKEEPTEIVEKPKPRPAVRR